MSSQAQIDANRLNAQKSTGPQCRFHSSTSTPEGRAAVRLNGVTHGLTAETLVLKGESESDFKAVFEALEAEYQPATPTEETLVADLAMATWRRRRLYNMEVGYYNQRLRELADYANQEKCNDSCRLGMIADSNNNTMALIGRQEARLERSYYRALHELQRLRKEREAKLALVCKSEVGPSQALPSQQTNSIPSPLEPMIAVKIPTPSHPITNQPPDLPYRPQIGS
jgi:hypothetical protein